MHRDVVFDIPPTFENLGSSALCAIQGLYRPGKVLTIQGHPEFDTFITGEILKTRYARNVLDEEVYKESMSRVALSHQGVEIGVAICRFLVEKKIAS
jgi:GMP synthase-like glutamine amidotransferase